MNTDKEKISKVDLEFFLIGEVNINLGSLEVNVGMSKLGYYLEEETFSGQLFF